MTEPPTDLSVNIPIGRAITGVEAFAVDETGAPVAAGEVGELWVRGPTVMIGYWGDAERSAASLVPFGVPHLPDRAYRTGDLVEADTDGNWIYRGRRDHQIKLRGYRIELGDVEAAIASHPDVKECAVVLSSDKRGEPVLAAFVVGGVEGRDLVDHVAEALPSYMLPSEWHHLDALPRTSTDKIDRRALPPLSRD